MRVNFDDVDCAIICADGSYDLKAEFGLLEKTGPIVMTDIIVWSFLTGIEAW